jgi:hypothetical protein
MKGGLPLDKQDVTLFLGDWIVANSFANHEGLPLGGPLPFDG